jgi:hypothetical protein
VTVARADRELVAEKGSAPRLVVFMSSHGNVEEAAVIGDMVKVLTKTSEVYKAFLVLIATDYVADLKYPKAYCNILGFLQQFVVSEG